MTEPRLPEGEKERLKALHATNLLDTPLEERFDRITRLAAAVFQAPIALISLVDESRQWFKSRCGLPAAETPRETSFCSLAILSEHKEPFVVEDAALDERFATNPLVTGEPHVRFYAGRPVSGPDGHRLGTLCIIDTRPRTPSARELDLLRDLASLVEEEIVKTVSTQRIPEPDTEPGTGFFPLNLHMENSPLAVIEWDGNLRIKQWSRRAEEMFGWSADEVVAKDATEWRFVHEESMTHLLSVMARLMDARESRNVSSTRNFRKYGTTIHCIWHNSALYNADGSVHSILSLVQDISAEVMARNALRDSEALFSATFEQAAVGIAHLAPNGSWLRVNQKMCDIIGYSREEIHGLHFQDITHPDDLAGDLAMFQRAATGELASYSREKRYIRKNGTSVWVNLTMSLRKNEQGRPLHFIAVVEDIQARKDAELALREAHENLERKVGERTEELRRTNESLVAEVQQRRQAEHTLAGSEKRLRAIADNLPAAIVHVDRDERFMFVNSTTASLLGKQPEELIGLSLRKAYGDEAYQLRKPHIESVLAGERVTFESEFIIGEKHIYNQAVYVPDVDQSGRVIGFYAMGFDVTDRKNSELRVAESEDRLRAVTDSLPVLIAYIDREERFRFANAMYGTWCAMPPAQVIGQTVREIVGDEIYLQHKAILKRALSGERVEAKIGMYHAGSMRMVDSVFVPHIRNGVVEGVYSFTTDVTEARGEDLTVIPVSIG